MSLIPYYAQRGASDLGAGEVEKLLSTAANLCTAATSVYLAGRWSCPAIDPAEQARLWVGLRDALGLEPGAATKAGVGADFREVATAINDGAFRMGARAMLAAIAERGSHLLAERAEAKRPQSGTDYIEATLAYVADTPIPTMPEPALRPEPEWQWWAGDNEEWFSSGPHPTREVAIDQGRDYFGEEAILHIVEAAPQRVTFSASNLIEAQYFECDDYFSGEHGDPDRVGGPDVVKAADAELQSLLDWWASRWQHTFNRPEMFAATRNSEVVPAEAVAA